MTEKQGDRKPNEACTARDRREGLERTRQFDFGWEDTLLKRIGAQG